MSFFSSLGSFFTNVRDWFASPATTAAVQNIEVVAEALICEIGSAAALSATIMQQVGAGQSTLGTTNKIYVASSTICSAMGGTVVGTASAPVKAVTSVS